MSFTLHHDWVLIESLGETVSSGGVIVPAPEQADPSESGLRTKHGIVVGVGRGVPMGTADLANGEFLPTAAKIGQKVVYQIIKARPTYVDGKWYDCARDGDVLLDYE